MNSQNKKDVNSNYVPADSCIICNKKLEEVRGERIIAQRSRGIIVSDHYQDGNQKYPRQSHKLSQNPDRYLVIWGDEELWTENAIKRAKKEYLEGKQSWFCQICGNRTCDDCGSPMSVPMGSDILGDDGSSSHVAIIPVAVKCINPNCS